MKAESYVGEMLSYSAIQLKVGKCLFGCLNEAQKHVKVKKMATKDHFSPKFMQPSRTDAQ